MPHGEDGRGTRTRRMAIEVILECDGGRRAFIDEVLEHRLSSEDLPEKDRHLLQEIAYGTVRHRNTLDHLLNRHVRLPMKRQEPPLRWGLRVGAYQVVYLGRIPAHAAIDGTLEAVKGLGASARGVGFLNAVLRALAGSIARKAEEPPLDLHDPTVIPIRQGYCHFGDPVLPLHTTDPVPHLALKHSHPAWLVARWRERFGEEETVALLESSNAIPRLFARLTARAPSREEVVKSLQGQAVVEEGPAASTLLLRKTGDPRKLEALHRGWIQIQDPTATAVGQALEPPPEAHVLDLCAAPGGKAALVLERLGPGGRLVACDIDEGKLERLKENLSRIGGSFTARLVPPEPEKLELGESFSHVLIDAPCSNTGVLGRRPEARWRVHAEDLASLVDRQRKLLEAAARHLRPGGRLVYGTCSIEPEENQGVVEWALGTLPRLRRVSERLFLPQRDGTDGGYYAILEVSGGPAEPPARALPPETL